MRMRGDDNKEDEDEGQQGGQGTTTRTWDKYVDDEVQKYEYKDCTLKKIIVLCTIHSITDWLKENLFLLINP